MSEGHEGEPFGPVILKVVDEDPEILLNFLVDSFSLSICLWVVGSGYVCLDLEQVIEVFHELGDEHGASVRDDYLRYSVLGIYFVT